MRRNILLAAATVALAGLMASTGCVRVPIEETPSSVGEERETVELGGAESVEARIDMPVGELTMVGGASDLLEADFRFQTRTWRPDVSYEVRNGTGELRIDQEDISGDVFGKRTNEWDLRFADGVALDMTLNLGAGTADLDCSSMDLRRLSMKMGAGDATIDISGDRDEDLDVDVTAGAGKLVMLLPRDVGVRVRGLMSGFGSFDAPGFETEGDALVNRAYGETSATVEVSVVRGVGDVTLELVD